MLEVPVFNMEGQKTGAVSVDPDLLGTKVRPALLKQAIVSYNANARQNTSATKSRGMVEGSTRKLYRQKGTGNARVGPIRTCIRRGGGVAFAKGNQNYSVALPKKMRRLARNNAILAKMSSEDVLCIEGMSFDEPKTGRMAQLLKAVGAGDGAVIAMHQPDDCIYRSGRNISKTEVRVVGELNAYDILRRKKLVFTKAALEMLTADPVTVRTKNGDDA